MSRITIFFVMITVYAVCVAGQKNPWKLGIECINACWVEKNELHTKRVGIVTNQTGIDSQGRSSVACLHKLGANLVCIFAPEHGYKGTTPAGMDVVDERDEATGIPIVSLYAHKSGVIGRAINSEKMAQIDVILFDMQDSGMRHYTYISTLMRCLEAACLYEKKIVVFDRPNILGRVMSGPLVQDAYRSFISIAPIPLRHGMTIGEVALFFNTHVLPKPASLEVVRMKNYNRQAVKALAAPLSPNLASIQSCYGYSFLGLLGEIQPFYIGIGTKLAFSCIMLPEKLSIDDAVWQGLQVFLKRHGISSKKHKAIKSAGNIPCRGLVVSFGDIEKLDSFGLFLQIVEYFITRGVSLVFSSAFDKAVGTDAIRTMLLSKVAAKKIAQSYARPVKQFFQKAQGSFLYTPHPSII